jgi:hypothetical protein
MNEYDKSENKAFVKKDNEKLNFKFPLENFVEQNPKGEHKESNRVKRVTVTTYLPNRTTLTNNNNQPTTSILFWMCLP